MIKCDNDCFVLIFLSVAVVLNRGIFRQRLETFLVVTSGGGDRVDMQWVGGGQGRC